MKRYVTCSLNMGAWVLLLTLSHQAFANNWMRSEDEFYFKAGLSYDTAKERWNHVHELVDISCTASNWKHNQSYEYGLSYYHTLFGSLEYLDRRCGERVASGVGDLSLGIRGRLNIFRNGRTWEAAVIAPTGYESHGEATIGSGLYGLRLGLFGSFGDRHVIRDEAGKNFELGGNIYMWEGSAPEQFAGYAKFNIAPSAKRHFYAAIEGDYALVDRSREFVVDVNQTDTYGYDRLNLRVGYSQNASLYWRVSIEATSVMWGRNTSKTNGITIGFNRSFRD